MTKEGKRFLLLYGSQTGQAKAIAEEIAENSSQHGFFADIHCLSLTEKKFWLEREKLVVIVSSTTGDGEPPDTAGKFCRRLKKKTLPADYLVNVNYTILGLGDSNYSNFCNCAKNINRRFEELGANTFYEPGWADDAVGLEVIVEPWLEGLYKALGEYFNKQNMNSSENPTEILQGASSRVCGGDTNAEIIATDKVDSNGIHDDVDNVSINSDNTKRSNIDDRTSDSRTMESTNIASNEPNAPNDTTSNSQGLNETNTKVVDQKSSVKISDEATQSTNENAGNPNDQKLSAKISNEATPSANENIGISKEQESSAQCTVAPSLTFSAPPLSESGLTLPLLQPEFLNVVFEDAADFDVSTLPIQNGAPQPSSKAPTSLVPVISTSVLTTQDSVKTTLQFVLDTSNCNWDYCAGDSIGVICPNTKWEVEKLIKRLGLDADADNLCTLSVIPGTKKKRAAVPDFIPERCTLRHMLTTCCDIRIVPKKAFLRSLVEYTSNSTEKRRIQELCSKQGAQDYTKYIREPSVSVIDILMAFPSCQPPVNIMLEHLPRLQARPYSAASSPKLEPGKLSFVFNMIAIPEGEGRAYNREGVCTGWLQGLAGKKQGDSLVEEMEKLTIKDEVKLPIFLRSNQYFRPPNDVTTPIIMIGPGTGVAPFIGFLQHRQWQQTTTPETVAGETWLFFGCRHQDRDYLFRDEMKSFVTNNTLSRLLVSFSRDTQEPGTPKYVQDNIQLCGQQLAELIMDKGAMAFVCGDANNMAKNVSQAFADILVKHKGLTQKDAEGAILQMRLHKRYLEDVWT